MLREGSFALSSFGRVRKVHETAFAVAFGRKSVALKRMLDAALESPSSPGEASFADLMDVLLAIAFTPIDRLAFVRPALLQPVVPDFMVLLLIAVGRQTGDHGGKLLEHLRPAVLGAL